MFHFLPLYFSSILPRAILDITVAIFFFSIVAFNELKWLDRQKKKKIKHVRNVQPRKIEENFYGFVKIMSDF